MIESEISGIQNEIDFSQALDNKPYRELGSNASKFVKQLYPNIEDNDTIHAQKVGGKGLKPDVIVRLHNDETNISLKKGSGNSVHQEKISLFLLYCSEYLDMPEKTRNSFLAFLYGDGTLDGRGAIEDRIEGEELYAEYREEIKDIQSFLIANSRALIERFLVYGRLGKELNIKADYLYHGFISDGVWCPLDETVDFLVQKANEQILSKMPTIGPLTIQAWNRNLSGKASLEDRRNSIQVKWGGKIREYIEEINKIYLRKVSLNPTLSKPKIFGDNSHGFSNVKEIVNGLNGCRVRNLRGSLLGFINTMFKGVALTDVISCKVINSAKPDMQITIGDKTLNVSIFLGSGNSVHQENFLEFLSFCREELHMSRIEEESLRFIYYGDGTLDGSGELRNRIKDSRTIKIAYPEKAAIAQDFFDKNRKELAKRFLISGKYSDKPNSDCVFHGDVENGISLSYDYILDYIENFSGTRNGLLSIGPLSFQMWNRNLDGDPKKEYKRNSLQIKWPSMPERIKEAQKIAQNKVVRAKIKGINAEYELVSLLNRDRSQNNPLWIELRTKLGLTGDNIYAIRVTKKAYSKFLNQSIFPKSDIYLCRASIADNLLQNIGYALDEEFVNEFNINISIVPGSGISCKIPTSTKFTYSKISVSNFEKIFRNNVIGAGASIFVKQPDIYLNEKVL